MADPGRSKKALPNRFPSECLAMWYPTRGAPRVKRLYRLFSLGRAIDPSARVPFRSESAHDHGRASPTDSFYRKSSVGFSTLKLDDFVLQLCSAYRPAGEFVVWHYR